MRFSCPKCGGDTGVSQTRINKSGLRRTRRCLKDKCKGRLTTQEVIVLGGRQRFDGSHVVIPSLIVDRMAELARDLNGLIEHRQFSYGEEADGAW